MEVVLILTVVTLLLVLLEGTKERKEERKEEHEGCKCNITVYNADTGEEEVYVCKSKCRGCNCEHKSGQIEDTREENY